MNQKTKQSVQQPTVSALTLSLIAMNFTALTACQPVMTGVKDFGSSINSAVTSTIEPTASQTTDQTMGEKPVLGSMYRLVIEANRIPCDSPKPMQCMIAEVTLDEDTDKKQPLYLQIPYTAINNFRAHSNSKYVISARPFIDQQTKKASGTWQLESVVSQTPVNRRN